MAMNLNHLRYAVAIARAGTISAAASQLGVSQPSVSIALRELERRAGRRLFKRTPGVGVELTPFGRTFLEQAKTVLRESYVLDDLITPGVGLRGELIVDCFEDLAPYCLAPIVASLQSEHPALQVTFAELDFASLAERLRLGIADVTITYDVGIPSGRHLITLQSLSPYALLSVEDPLANRKEVRLVDLAKRILILSSRLESAEHFLGLFRLHAISVSRYRMIDSFELQRSLIANGLGCGLSYTRPDGDMSYDGRKLCCLPIADVLPTLRVLAILSRPPSRSSPESFFLAAAKSFYQSRTPLNAGRSEIAC